MTDDMDVEVGKRHKAVIDGENYYIFKSDKSMMATIPYENRPENMKKRLVVDGVCNAATEIMGGSNK